jgi:spore germination cell wall hydrolase CwlJ-like protein
MIHEPKFEAAEPLRKALDAVDTNEGRSTWSFHVFLAILLAIAAVTWASYDRWSGPVMNWLDTDSANASPANKRSVQRTAEQQMLIDVTQGEPAETIVTGENALAVNAALPFSGQPVSAARPFRLAATTAVNAQHAQTCLTQAIYYEAGFEPLAGKQAVAQVVLNRVKHPAFPSSVCGVVYQGHLARVCQFSFTCDGALFRKPQKAAWAASQSVAAAALAGYVEPSVGTATHYHADYVSPYWAPKLAKIKKLGAHIFYAWPGGWGRRAAFTSRYTGSEYLPSLEMIRKPAEPFQEPDAVNFAKTGLSVPPAVTDRHAETDVGGRLDVNKGWTLRIPKPSETRESFAKLRDNQHAPSPAGRTVSEGGGL